jgi:hypothetical protein
MMRYNRILENVINDSLENCSDVSSDDVHVIDRSDNLIYPAIVKILKS